MGDRGAPPAVSAVITNHDYGEFVAEAVDSVLEQDLGEPLEVVVVDDGSTDRSAAVLAAYGDRIRVIRQENRGQLVALRTGMAAARGDYVCFLDADDAWASDKVTQVVEAFRGGTHDWIAHGLAVCDDRLRPTGRTVRPAGRSGRVPGDPILFLERRAGTATSGLAVRRELAAALVRAVDELETELTAALRHDADRLLLALIGTLRRSGYQIAAPLARYRLHGRQQFAGEHRRAALLERQVAVDQVVAEVMERRLGWGRTPTSLHKHRLVLAALRSEGERGRILLAGLREAARLLRSAPLLAVRQTLALVAAAQSPRRWLARMAERQGLPT